MQDDPSQKLSQDMIQRQFQRMAGASLPLAAASSASPAGPPRSTPSGAGRAAAVFLIVGLAAGAAGTIGLQSSGVWPALSQQLGLTPVAEAAPPGLTAESLSGQRELLRQVDRLKSENLLLKESETVLRTGAEQLEKRAGEVERLAGRLERKNEECDRLRADLENAAAREKRLLEGAIGNLAPAVDHPSSKRTARILQVEVQGGLIAIDRGRAHGLRLGQAYTVRPSGSPDQPPVSIIIDEVKENFSLGKASPTRRLQELKVGDLLTLEE